MIRVLVIDDSDTFLAAASGVIGAADGFELEGVAATGEDGIELALLHRPDLALVDLNMPGIDGRETAARIAAISPETGIVVMSATLESDEVFDKRSLSPATLTEIWDRARTPSPAGAAELEGVWDVHRTGGALPPMRGIFRKRIADGRGWTIALGVRVPFAVEGLTLRYPLGLADELVPDGPDAYDGTTRLFGRTVGTFRLTRARSTA